MQRDLTATYPRDSKGQTLPTFDYRNGLTLSVSTGSARVQLGTLSNTLLITASIECYIKFGDVTVTAATSNGNHDFYMPAGASWIVPKAPGATYIAAISSGSGALHISEAF